MDPLSVTASIIAVVQLSNAVITYCIGFSVRMKGADQEIKEVISELRDIQSLLSEVQAVLPEDDRPENSEVSGIYSALEAVNAIINDISNRLAPLLKGGFKNHLKWPFEERAIREKLEKLQKQKATFQLFFSLQQTKLMLKQSNDATDLVDGAKRDYRVKVLDWYKTSDPEQNHQVSRKHHEPQTCGWVFELEKFKSWVSNNGESLWIHGIPGAGKTIICSTIIEYMKNLNVPSEVVYYYFDFSDTKKQTFKGFLQSAIYQLLVANPDIPEVATVLYEKHAGNQQPGHEDLFELFLALASRSKVFAIIDAIDECPKQERTDFLQLFVDKLQSRVNLLVTSRREADIEKVLGNFTHILSVEDSQVDADVRIHVANAMATHPAFQSWTSAVVKKQVLDSIVAGCRGMFRWAVCQLDVMKQCSTPRMVRAELGRMPKTLDQTYDRILQSIPEMHKTFVESALRWLVFSERPLLLAELGEAAVIDPSFGPFNADESRFLDPGKILELCGSLITIGQKKVPTNGFRGGGDWLLQKCRNESRYSTRDLPLFTTVSLSHYSVKEYLTAERLQTGTLSRYFMEEKLSHRFLTQCAILYFQGIEAVAGEVGTHLVDTPRVYIDYPLLEYCGSNWMGHCRKGGIDSNLINLLTKFFDLSNPTPYLSWLNSYDPDLDTPATPARHREGTRRMRNLNVGRAPPPLYWAVQLGNVDITMALIANGAEADGPAKGFLGSPLSVASYYRFEDVVKVLLENGANPNGGGGFFGTVLQSAACGGSIKIVEMLVKAGANINKVGGAWNTALIAAATHGHGEVASFLLQSRPDVNIDSPFHGSALYQAALAGDARTTIQILNTGADIDLMGPHGTPLYGAVLSGSVTLVQTLLNRGADVNKGGRGEWGYPLTAAAKSGNVSIAKALIRAGANVNAQKDSLDFDAVSALEAAIESSNMEMFKTILGAGGDPDLQGCKYPSSLFCAFHHEEFGMAKILLEKGVKVSDETFLKSMSIWQKDQWFLRTILEMNPNINSYKGFKGCALHRAVYARDEELIRLILTKGPYIDSVSVHGTVLTHAISKGLFNIANELIKKGARVNKPQGSRNSLASLMGFWNRRIPLDFGLADRLIELGVEVNGRDRENIVMSAVMAERPEAILYLGRRGVDFNIPPFGHQERSPLQAAAIGGNIAVVDALLEFGADVNGPPGRFGTALHYAVRGYNKKHTEAIFRRFLANGAILNDEPASTGIICAALENNLRGLVPELIALGADVNKPSSSDKDWIPLAMAIRNRDVETEQLLRNNGANWKNIGADAIQMVIKEGRIEILEEMLQGGLDPNIYRPYRSPSILDTAINTGHKEMVELLISYGASVNNIPGTYNRPLITAIETDNRPMVEYLLQMGANPNGGRYSSLSSAVGNGCFNLIDLLFEHGADVMAFGGAAFRPAVHSGEKMLLYLLERVPLEHRGKALDSALQTAAEWARLDICELLLSVGADADFVGGAKGSPLHAALSNINVLTPNGSNNRKALFTLLLEKGAKPRELEGHPSVLVLALESELDPSFVLDLLEAGADPNGKGSDKYDSPLQAAAKFAPSLIEPLIQAGADVNAVGGNFGTALHIAARQSDCRAIAVLLKHGAKLDSLSPKYGGVIQAAASCEASSLKKRKMWLVSKRCLQTMELLHMHGASVHTAGGISGSALQMAIYTGNVAAVKWLLDRGADPNVKGPEGTAVQAAIENDKWGVLTYLEQRYGQTPDEQ
ncbi:hypothetical protein TWF718_001218 [Orbilia javanica]|uniref:NACHT domain-containing protein n=1 Tax=Orbilia javanica TaxID=47235 RepID=A0AAN8RN59_9PEZI